MPIVRVVRDLPHGAIAYVTSRPLAFPPDDELQASGLATFRLLHDQRRTAPTFLHLVRELSQLGGLSFQDTVDLVVCVRRPRLFQVPPLTK